MTEADKRSAELMRALVAGDDAAMKDLVELWELPLLHFCLRYLQNESEARDVVQDTFVRIHAHRERYDPRRSFASWLFTVAANLCRNHRRWQRRHPLLSLEWLLGAGTAREQPCCAAPGPDQTMEGNERIAEIRAAVDALSHELKTTLLLHEYENMGYEEIAQVLGCSRKGVEARLSRARIRLRRRLSGLLEKHGGSMDIPAGAGVTGSSCGR